MVRHRSRRWVRLGWITGLVLLLATVTLVAGFSEEKRFVLLLHRAKPKGLLAAATLQFLTYVCAAGVWQRTLARQGTRRPLWSFISLGLAKLFTDQTVPSVGLSGTVLMVHALGRRGISRVQVMVAFWVGLFGYYLAYSLAVAAALIILWVFGDLNRWLVTLVSGFAATVAAIPLLAVWLRRHSNLKGPAWLNRLPGFRETLQALGEASPGALRDKLLLGQVTLLQCGIFLLDAATLRVMLYSVGWPVGLGPVFACFVVASVVASLMFVPGGVGTFEGSSVAMLHLFGVPLEEAFAATLLLRGFTFWLPMLPGLWLARREML